MKLTKKQMPDIIAEGIIYLGMLLLLIGLIFGIIEILRWEHGKIVIPTLMGLILCFVGAKILDRKHVKKEKR